jgi:hypothetical protein
MLAANVTITNPANNTTVDVEVSVTGATVTKYLCSTGSAAPADGDTLTDVQAKIYPVDPPGTDNSPSDPTNEAGTTEGAFDSISDQWWFDSANNTLIPGVVASNAASAPYPTNKLVVWCEFTPGDGSAAYWVKGIVPSFSAIDAADASCGNSVSMSAARNSKAGKPKAMKATKNSKRKLAPKATFRRKPR